MELTRDQRRTVLSCFNLLPLDSPATRLTFLEDAGLTALKDDLNLNDTPANFRRTLLRVVSARQFTPDRRRLLLQDLLDQITVETSGHDTQRSALDKVRAELQQIVNEHVAPVPPPDLDLETLQPSLPLYGRESIFRDIVLFTLYPAKRIQAYINLWGRAGLGKQMLVDETVKAIWHSFPLFPVRQIDLAQVEVQEGNQLAPLLADRNLDLETLITHRAFVVVRGLEAVSEKNRTTLLNHLRQLPLNVESTVLVLSEYPILQYLPQLAPKGILMLPVSYLSEDASVQYFLDTIGLAAPSQTLRREITAICRAFGGHPATILREAQELGDETEHVYRKRRLQLQRTGLPHQVRYLDALSDETRSLFLRLSRFPSAFDLADIETVARIAPPLADVDQARRWQREHGWIKKYNDYSYIISTFERTIADAGIEFLRKETVREVDLYVAAKLSRSAHLSDQRFSLDLMFQHGAFDAVVDMVHRFFGDNFENGALRNQYPTEAGEWLTVRAHLLYAAILDQLGQAASVKKVVEAGLEHVNHLPKDHPYAVSLYVRLTVIDLRNRLASLASTEFHTVLAMAHTCIERLDPGAQKSLHWERAQCYLVQSQWCYYCEPDPPGAYSAAKQAVALYKGLEVKDEVQLAKAQSNLATCAIDIGKMQESKDLSKSLIGTTASETLRSRRWQLDQVKLSEYANLVDTCIRLGEWEDAHRYGQSGLKALKRHALQFQRALVAMYLNLAHLHLVQHLVSDETFEFLATAGDILDVFEDSQNFTPERDAFLLLAYLERGDHGRVRALASRLTESDSPISHYVQGCLAVAEEDWYVARASFDAVRGDLDPYWRARAEQALGRVYAATGDTPRQREVLLAARATFSELDAKRYIRDVDEALTTIDSQDPIA